MAESPRKAELEAPGMLSPSFVLIREVKQEEAKNSEQLPWPQGTGDDQG